MSQSQRQAPLAVITIHDACPAFSTKIFKFTNELEKLGVRYNTALVPFFNEKQDPVDIIVILYRTAVQCTATQGF